MKTLRKPYGIHFHRTQLSGAVPTAISRAIAEVLENRLCLSAVNVLTAFDGSTDGLPEGGVIISGNTLFGTTHIGGDNNAEGEVYSMPITGGNPDLIAGFNGTDGSGPSGNLLLVNDTLYGVTNAGGANNDGVVFSLPTAGGTPTVLATFNGANGTDPEAGLIVSNNILYGTTFSGGANNAGEVFSLPITGGTVSVLASFSTTDGKNPDGTLALQDGILYGNTRIGGGFNGGTIFSLPITGGSPTVLADMSPTVGEISEGPLVLLNNTLYGAASADGSLAKGTIFSVNISGGTPTVLFNFDNTHGAIPAGGLTLANGILYGTTAEGGVNNLGTLFGMFPVVSTPTVLASFDSTVGSLPFSTPTLSNSVLFGTTMIGTSGNSGSVFSVPANSTSTLTFTVSPFNEKTNTPFAETLSVTAEKPDGTIDTSSNGVYQLSIGSGPVGAKLLGTTTATAVGGVATFSGVSIDTQGTYTLSVTDIVDGRGTSDSFEVELADTFSFVTAPTTGVVDMPLSSVVVQATTALGTVDTSYNGLVYLQLFGDSGFVNLAGTSFMNASNGVATFSDLTPSTAGSFQLHINNSVDASSLSQPISILINPSELTAGVDITHFPLPDGGLLGGAKATATLTLNNSTGTLASGVMKVDLYLTSLNDVIRDAAGTDYTQGRSLYTPSLNRVVVNIPAGKSKKINVTFTVPSYDNDEVGQVLAAVLTPVSGFGSPSLPKQAVINGNYDGVNEFGTVDGRARVTLAEYVLGTFVRFSLTGPGKGVLTEDFDEDPVLEFTGTTAATNINITASQAFTINSITTDGAVGAINAPQLSMNGSVSLTGGVRQIRMGNLTSSLITIGGATPVSISLGNLLDSSIVSTAPVRSLVINSFSHTGGTASATSIQAASITSFTDKEDFAGNLATTGNLGQVLIRGNLTGDILAGTNLGTDNTPGGKDDTFGPATLSSVHVVGNVSASLIAAGLSVQNDTFLRANFSLLGNSKIVAVRVDGSLSNDSLVLSSVLPVKAIIAGQRLTTANDSRFKVQLPE